MDLSIKVYIMRTTTKKSWNDEMGNFFFYTNLNLRMTVRFSRVFSGRNDQHGKMAVVKIKCSAPQLQIIYLIKHRKTIFLNHILMLRFNILKNDLHMLFEKIFRGENSIRILEDQLWLVFVSALLYWSNLYLYQWFSRCGPWSSSINIA